MNNSETDTLIIANIECESCNDHYLYCGSCDGSRGKLNRNALATHIAPLSDGQQQALDDVLRIREHETHRMAQHDYLVGQGARWKEIHQRHVDELALRERFGLPDHEFGECCKITLDDSIGEGESEPKEA